MSASATERLDDEIVEDLAIAVDGGGDVAGRELVGAALVRLLDLARGEELGDDLALLALADDRIVDVVARLSSIRATRSSSSASAPAGSSWRSSSIEAISLSHSCLLSPGSNMAPSCAATPF